MYKNQSIRKDTNTHFNETEERHKSWTSHIQYLLIKEKRKRKNMTATNN